MIRRTVALRYARALFGMSATIEDLENRLDDFDSIQTLLEKNPKLRHFLEAPQIEVLEKRNLLESVLADKVNPVFFRFFIFLIEKRRLSYLAQIALEYRLMVDKYLDIWEAKVITAVPIGPDIEEKLKVKLENFYRKKIKIKKEIDPRIIGGAIFLVANEMIDWSVTGRLKKMKENLLESK